MTIQDYILILPFFDNDGQLYYIMNSQLSDTKKGFLIYYFNLL